MAFSISCPKCATKLKTAAAVPAGKSVQCPKCKAVFTAPEAEDEEAPAPAKKRSVGDVLASSAANKNKRRADDDEDDDRPRRRRRDEEENEAPARSRKRAAVDDDEDDDDLDRRAAEEDADEAPRPKKKKKKKKQQGKSAVFWLLLGLSSLLFVGGGAFLFFWLMSGSSFDGEMLAYAPADTKVIGGGDYDAVMKNEKFKALNQKMQGMNPPELEKAKQALGVTDDDISKAMFASTADMDSVGKRGDTVVVVKLKEGKGVDRAKVKTALKATEVSKDGKAYLKTKDFCVYLPSDTMAVVSLKEAHMAKVLAVDPKQVALTGTMKDLVDKAGGSHFWVAALIGGGGKAGGGGGMGGIGAMMGGPAADIGNAATGAKGFAFYGDFSGNAMQINASLVCASSDVASKAAKALSTMLSELKKADFAPKGMGLQGDLMKAMTDSASVGSSGDMITGYMKLPIEILEQIAGGGMPFGGMGGMGGFNNGPPPGRGGPGVIRGGPGGGVVLPQN